ncbi:MAG: hypothetical protein WA989_05175, partial [Henriciella sp.]|uniref:hypothetical protein n=1 Tax=Henriciella sp. TaxID=1968823 RepID=UPI003C7396DC
MTAARTGFSLETLFLRVGNGLREAARWALRGALALVIIFMAGVIAVVTAGVGLIVAAIAILLRLTGARGKTTTYRTHTADSAPSDGITLDAHRTARGWTV